MMVRNHLDYRHRNSGSREKVWVSKTEKVKEPYNKDVHNDLK